MTTLTEFLLARIAEDETANPTTMWHLAWEPSGVSAGQFPTRAAAEDARARLLDRRTVSESWMALWEAPRSGTPLQRALRVRAECEAKRRIAALHQVVTVPYSAWSMDEPERDVVLSLISTCRACAGNEEGPCATLKAVGATYIDHPDYREEWNL